jgi:hypothetical protein
MRTLLAGLALAALVAACTDQPTTPLVPEPQFAQLGAEHGAAVVRYPNCFIWDAEGNPFEPPVPCQYVYTPSKSGVLTMLMKTEGVPNPFGVAVHFGPTRYPQWWADLMWDLFQIGPVDGKMPGCDYNLVTDPDMTTLICSYNWRMTISASGEMVGTTVYDPAHSFSFPCYHCWG